GRGLAGAEGAGLVDRGGAGGGDGPRRHRRARGGQAAGTAHHPDGPGAHALARAAGPGRGGGVIPRHGRGDLGERAMKTRGWRACAWALVALSAAGGRAGAADVAVVKSSEVAAWRPAIDALRRGAASQ